MVITGVSPSSLGLETVHSITPYAQTIIVVGRSKEKCVPCDPNDDLEGHTRSVLKVFPLRRMERGLTEIQVRSGEVDVRLVALDLTSLSSIRSAAMEILEMQIPIHVRFLPSMC